MLNTKTPWIPKHAGQNINSSFSRPTHVFVTVIDKQVRQGKMTKRLDCLESIDAQVQMSTTTQWGRRRTT